MAGKMVPVSTRISEQDVEFISQLPIEGASTPSDKIRAIIGEARRRSEGMQDYTGALQMMQELFAPVREQILTAEAKHGGHSELVLRIVEWLPDIAALLLSTMNRSSHDIDSKDLISLERGAADRVFRIVESVLQMAVTRTCPCYEGGAVRNRIEPVLELAAMISGQER